MSVENVRIVRIGKTALDTAVAENDEIFLSASPTAQSWFRGQVWQESRFGQTEDWQGSNNFGGVVYHLGDGHFVEHGDRDKDGKPIGVKFQAYATPLDGARDFLRIVWRGHVPLAIHAGTLRDYAAALYANGYFTGTVGSADDRAIAYAAMVFNGSTFCDKLLEAADAQDRLRELGFDPGLTDGVPGPKTALAVERFQAAFGLPVDGVLNPLTRAELFRGT